MSEVYRYDLSLPTNAKNFGMRLSENGCWVEHESYAALESERDLLRARVEELERRQAMLPSDLRVIADIGFPATAERVNGELEALRHDLRKVMDSRNAEVNALESLRASIAALADEWDAIAKRQRYQAEMDSRRDYADSATSKYGRAIDYEACARELRKLGEGNSAAAQEGL